MGTFCFPEILSCPLRSRWTKEVYAEVGAKIEIVMKNTHKNTVSLGLQMNCGDFLSFSNIISGR